MMTEDLSLGAKTPEKETISTPQGQMDLDKIPDQAQPPQKFTDVMELVCDGVILGKIYKCRLCGREFRWKGGSATKHFRKEMKKFELNTEGRT